MTAARRPPEATRKLRRLRSIAPKLRTISDLQTERAQLYEELQELGVSQREIAEAAHVSEVAVNKVLAKRRKVRT